MNGNGLINGLTRVTDIISPWVEGKEYFTDETRERGNIVHRACLAYIKGLWTPDLGIYQGYVESLKLWVPEMVEEVILCEERLECPELGITGQMDLICRVKSHEGLSIVDWKTSVSKQKAWALQLAGYKILAEANGYTPIKHRFGIQLDPNGGQLRLSYYSDIIDEKAFLEALDLWRYFSKE